MVGEGSTADESKLGLDSGRDPDKQLFIKKGTTVYNLSLEYIHIPISLSPYIYISDIYKEVYQSICKPM